MKNKVIGILMSAFVGAALVFWTMFAITSCGGSVSSRVTPEAFGFPTNRFMISDAPRGVYPYCQLIVDLQTGEEYLFAAGGSGVSITRLAKKGEMTK